MADQREAASPEPPSPLAAAAIAVLHRNDRGTWTRPSPRLYPHQWSWDAAFVAIGWAHLDPGRALAELTSLCRGQWDTGMIPQIVFDPAAAEGTYEPGPKAWQTVGHSPPGTSTSGICQPPVHAMALERIVRAVDARTDLADDERAELDATIADLTPRLARWHRWLHDVRDPEGTGLVTILHPWESGLDNSPRWDAALDAISPGDPATALARPDLTHVADPAQRPTDGEYHRYLALVADLAALGWDQAAAMTTHPFRMADVWSSAILAAADDALARLADRAGDHRAASVHRADADRSRAGLDACWDPDRQACLDQDRIAGRPVEADTIAGFAPLIAGCAVDRAAILADRLLGPSYAGAPELAWPLPPSTAVSDPAFDPRGYWRGPQWAPMTWLLWDGLVRAGHRRTAEHLRRSALAQLDAVGCCEYVDARTGEALGSASQSWTAAVALDWLAAGDAQHQPYTSAP